MNIFDIIGPVMVGPSSSHTAGAARIGLMVRSLLEEEPVEAEIMLHGSFGQTYKGHGTDKAMIGGLLGFGPEDLRLRNSMELAQEKGLKYTITKADLGDVHPNSALIRAKGKSGKEVEVLGSSVGGGNIVINKIDSVDVEFTGQYHTLVIPHQDVPGSVAAVASILAENGINIAQMTLFRSKRGGQSLMIMETDEGVPGEISDMIRALPNISSVKVIKPV